MRNVIVSPKKENTKRISNTNTDMRTNMYITTTLYLRVKILELL